jgi:phage terminase Nu1 subunit (DNA packaging protein)
MSSDDLDSPDAFEGLPKPRGEVKSRTNLAKSLAKDVKTVDKMIRDGMPVFQRGDAATRTAHQIDLAAAWDWAIQRAREAERDASGRVTGGDGEDAYDEEKTRDKAAQATLRELAVEEAMGRLIDRATVIRFENERAELVRSQANALHTQVPDLTPEQRDALRLAVNAMLETLSVRYVPQHRVKVNEDAFDNDGDQ